MSTQLIFSHIVKDEAGLPLHLQHRRAAFTLPRTELVLKRPLEVICPGGDGKVEMAGAIEFMSQVTAGVLADFCDPEELFSSSMQTTSRFRVVYDAEIQRGVKDTKTGAKEFLRETQISSMMEDISNEQFECPQLMWNLRAGQTTWAYLVDAKELRVYQGVATRPDTNHRHHAVIRYQRKFLDWIENTGSTTMGTYNPNRQYGLVIYTDDFQGEAHRFYVYNFKGWRVSTSTAHYIESKTRIPAIHAKLARELMERSGILTLQNVEIVSNQLSRNSAKMLTFGTLTEALRTAYPALTETEYTETLEYFLKFLEQLNKVRPQEVAVLSVAQRQKVRDESVADQAVMWHGYLQLAAWLKQNDPNQWRDRLLVFAAPFEYKRPDGLTWSGDLFSRNNPLWSDRSILIPGKTGKRVVNNKDAKRSAFATLRDVVAGTFTQTAERTEAVTA